MSLSISALSSETAALHPNQRSAAHVHAAKRKYKDEADAAVLQSAAGKKETEDRAAVDFEDPSKSLLVAAKKIAGKIEELLKEKLPDGLKSLKPEDVTPDATASRIVSGTTAFFDIYAKQHPELQGEELIGSFLTAIKSGIDTGYDDAYETLEALGAFSFSGVREGVEATRSLIDQKLAAWENQKRKDLGLAADKEDAAAEPELQE